MAWLPSRDPAGFSLWLCAVALLCLGLWLLGGGIWLALLGGARYYVLAGVGMTASALLVLSGRESGVWLYQGVLFCTLIWALTEVGADLLALWPRLWMPVLLGTLLLLLLPTLRRRRARKDAR